MHWNGRILANSMLVLLILALHGCSREASQPAEPEPAQDPAAAETGADIAPSIAEPSVATAPKGVAPPMATPPMATLPTPPMATLPEFQLPPETSSVGGQVVAASETQTSPIELVSKDLRFVRVFYGTDRERTPPCTDTSSTSWNAASLCIPNEFYGSEPDNLEVGTLTVTFPPGHVKGNIERPKKLVVFTLRKEDPEKDVLISEMTSYGDRYNDWVQNVRNTGRKQAIIYVHGYANTFADAARRAAQVAYDLDFDVHPEFQGLTMMYSWPSRGKATLIAYNADKEASRNAIDSFNAFLDLVSNRAGVQQVHVVAHSMGNLLVAAALRDRGSSQQFLDQLVLAAPDIWADSLEAKFLANLPDLAKRVTLYVSEKDRALQASDGWNGNHKRVGQANGGFLRSVAERFDSIDASTLPSDFLAHSYYADNNSVLSDIYCLLKHNPPAKRPLIRPAGKAWEFRPADERAEAKTADCQISFPPVPTGDWTRYVPWVAVSLVALVIGFVVVRRKRAIA